MHTTTPQGLTAVAERVTLGRDRILTEIRKVIVGQDAVIEQVLMALFTGGHCLITGVPGLAKTLLIKTLAEILDLSFKRIQFTPDLMPADITGTEVLDEDAGHRSLRFVKGPIFAQILLADEINRTPPKTQAALLEAMQEYHVTAAGRTYQLERVIEWVLASDRREDPLLLYREARSPSEAANAIERSHRPPTQQGHLDRYMAERRPGPGTGSSRLLVTFGGEEVPGCEQVYGSTSAHAGQVGVYERRGTHPGPTP